LKGKTATENLKQAREAGETGHNHRESPVKKSRKRNRGKISDFQEEKEGSFKCGLKKKKTRTYDKKFKRGLREENNLRELLVRWVTAEVTLPLRSRPDVSGNERLERQGHTWEGNSSSVGMGELELKKQAEKRLCSNPAFWGVSREKGFRPR